MAFHRCGFARVFLFISSLEFLVTLRTVECFNSVGFHHSPFGYDLFAIVGLPVALTGPTVQLIRRAEASVFPSFFSQLKS